MWRDARAVIGASDAGAHLDLLATFNYTTTTARARPCASTKLLPLEEAVHLLTDVPARLYGLRDRGRIADGRARRPRRVRPRDDRGPAGRHPHRPARPARRASTARPTASTHVLVNGAVIVEHGEFTDARPGTLLRSGRDTDTPVLS